MPRKEQKLIWKNIHSNHIDIKLKEPTYKCIISNELGNIIVGCFIQKHPKIVQYLLQIAVGYIDKINRRH